MSTSGNGHLVVPGVIAVLTIAAFIWMILPGSQEPLPEPPVRSSLPNLPPARENYETTTDAATVCAPGIFSSSLGDAIDAARNGDEAALRGLIDRGDVLAINGGTRVKVLRNRDGEALVRILSGYHIGKTCRLASAFLR